MLVPLSRIDANPYRDIGLFPYDEEQIEKLQQSYDRHGVWGSIPARRVGDRYQIAMGHHRVEAARRKGLKEIDLDLREISDDEMVRLMTSENAIQAGNRAPAIMNEVSAAVRRLALVLLSDEHLSQIRERWPEIAQCFQSQKAFEVARGTLENGEGIGEPLIRMYLGGGNPGACPRSGHQIRDGLAALKSAGLYTKDIAAVTDEIAASAAEEAGQAEQAEREAKRAKAQAKTKTERDNAAEAETVARDRKAKAKRSSEAKSRAERATSTTTTKAPQTYDPACVRVFANAEQERAFREAVTKTAAARRFIPLDKQLPLAKKLVEDMRDRHEYRGRITATTISMYVSNLLQDAIRQQDKIDREERQQLMTQQLEQMFEGLFKNLQWSVNSASANAGKIFSFFGEHPEFAGDPRISAVVPNIQEAVSVLNGILREVKNGQAKPVKA